MDESELIDALKHVRTLDSGDIYQLCNEYQWFTCGSNQQYQKVMDAADNGMALSQLAAMIWICSEEEKLENILWRMAEYLEKKQTF